MFTSSEVLNAFFEVNVRSGLFKPHEYDAYVTSVITWGIAVIAQAQKNRIDPNDLLEKDFIGLTEDSLFREN